MEITKHFFLNFSFLIILLFMGLVLIDKRKEYFLSKSSIIIFFIVMLWSCIQFSYNPIPHARYDLRIIPIVIGSLYFGIGPILIMAAIVIRGFYGINLGFVQTLILYLPLSILVWKFHPRFHTMAPMRRVLVSIGFGIILGAITVFGMELNDTRSNWLDAWFAYLIIPGFGIWVISFMIEFIKKNGEMRNELIKAEKLKAVEQMGAAISHEIRNPLTAASGFVQLLEDDYLPRQKRKEYLSIVKDELISAERVIQDYLTFAKPSIEKFEELNVKSELKQIISIIQPLANQHSVEVRTDFSVIGFIKGDRQKFRQCFVNVFKNAIEAMPNGGLLSVSTDFSQKYITIKVTDTGLGMTNEQVQLLGEPFYSTKGKKGTGLGMMVVYSIVRAMNGSIWVESELGIGTTFHFKFPTLTSIMKQEH